MTTESANITRRLADRLMQAAMGELVTYADLSKAIDQDLKLVRHLIYRALNVASQESGAQFKTVYRKGYQRLASNELIKVGQAARKQIRRTARKASRGIDAGVRVANDLNPQELNAVLREQSVLGLIEVVAKDKNLPHVDLTETRPLTPGQSARQFLEAIGAKAR